jgi:hypothetical protein
MVRRRTGRRSPRSRSFRRDTPASTDERLAADQRVADRKAIFRAAVKRVLKRREIATQVQREGGVTAKDLEAQAEQFSETLWAPAEEGQQQVEALDEELRRLQRRLRIPALLAVRELIAYPYLQGAVAITGLLLIVWSLGLKLLRTGGASGWSRILFLFGVTMLVFALVYCVVGYVRNRAGRVSVPAIWPWLSTVSGLASAAYGVVQANRLSQYHTAAQLAFWVLLLTEGVLITARVYFTVTAAPVGQQVPEARNARVGAARRNT